MTGAARRREGRRPLAPASIRAAAPASGLAGPRVTLDGKPIAYAATASTIDLKNEKDEVIARMFSVAYTAEGPDASAEPVTFAFNGGRDRRRSWLHMGSFGPFGSETSRRNRRRPRPTRSSSTRSLLDRTDLVFIDAVGQGDVSG